MPFRLCLLRCRLRIDYKEARGIPVGCSRWCIRVVPSVRALADGRLTVRSARISTRHVCRKRVGVIWPRRSLRGRRGPYLVRHGLAFVPRYRRHGWIHDLLRVQSRGLRPDGDRRLGSRGTLHGRHRRDLFACRRSWIGSRTPAPRRIEVSCVRGWLRRRSGRRGWTDRPTDRLPRLRSS